LRRARPNGILAAVDRRRAEHFACRQRQELEDQRRWRRVVPLEERLRETIAWSAALLADDLERSGRRRSPATDPPDPVGLGPRRA
jgi:hypothetical protein